MPSGRRRPNKGRPRPTMNAEKRLNKLLRQGKRDQQCARFGCYRESEDEWGDYCSPACHEQDGET